MWDTQELDSVILVDCFQLRLFCESLNLEISYHPVFSEEGRERNTSQYKDTFANISICGMDTMLEQGQSSHKEVAEMKCYGLTAAPIPHSPARLRGRRWEKEHV